MRKKLSIVLVAIIYTSFLACSPDLEINPSTDASVGSELFNTENNASGEPVDAQTITQLLLDNNWFTEVRSINNSYTEIIGLSFTEQNEIYWGDVDGTFKGTYTIQNSSVEFNIRKNDQFIRLKYTASYHEDESGRIRFILSENNSTTNLIYGWTFGQSNKNGATSTSTEFLLRSTTWKPFLAYPSYPELSNELYIFSNGFFTITRNNTTLYSGSFKEDTLIKNIARATLSNGVRLIVLKTVDGFNDKKQISFSEFYPDGTVKTKYLNLVILP